MLNADSADTVDTGIEKMSRASELARETVLNESATTLSDPGCRVSRHLIGHSKRRLTRCARAVLVGSFLTASRPLTDFVRGVTSS